MSNLRFHAQVIFVLFALLAVHASAILGQDESGEAIRHDQNRSAVSFADAVAGLERDGAGAIAIAKMRLDWARSVLHEARDVQLDLAQSQLMALTILRPIIDSFPELLASEDSSKLAVAAMRQTISLTAEMKGCDEARKVASELITQIQASEKLSAENRLLLECEIQLTKFDLAFSDNEWDQTLEEFGKLLGHRNELCQSEEGTKLLITCLIQSIRYTASAGRQKEIRQVATTGIEWLEQANCISQPERSRWQAILVDQALDFTDVGQCPEDIDYWNIEAERRRREMIGAGDPMAAPFIGQLFEHSVMPLPNVDPERARVAWNDFRGWLRNDSYRAAGPDGALRSFVIASVRVLTLPQISREQFSVMYRETHAFLDEVDLAFPSDHTDVNAMRSQLDAGVTCALAKLLRPNKGQAAPGMRLVRVADGAEFSLSDLRGKVVLLDFWNVRCGACIAIFPLLGKLQNEFKDRGLEVVGCTFFYDGIWDNNDEEAKPQSLSRDEHLAKIREFAAKHNVDHPLAVGTEVSVQDEYGIVAQPTAYLIDVNGNVAGYYEGSDKINSPEFLANLKQLLGDVRAPTDK